MEELRAWEERRGKMGGGESGSEGATNESDWGCQNAPDSHTLGFSFTGLVCRNSFLTAPVLAKQSALHGNA